MIAFIDADVLVYASLWDAEDLEQSKDRYKNILNEAVEETFSEDYISAIGGLSNFREDIYDLYKKSPSRLKAKENTKNWLGELKAWVRTLENTVTAQGCEADDLLRMWSTQATEFQIPFVVVTIDKDLDCIPGLHYNPAKKIGYSVTEEEGDHHYWKQVLTGDSVDNIPGLPKVGPVKAEAILSGAKSSSERKQRVIEAYKAIYGDHWKSYLLSNAKLIHIWRHENDFFHL